jgi:hypothetical protein
LQATPHEDAVPGALERDGVVDPGEHRRDLVGNAPAGQPLAVAPVQPCDVVQVDSVLLDLHEVARDRGVADVADRVVPAEQVVPGQNRGRAGAEVSEHQPAEFLRPVGRRGDPLRER